MSKQQDPQSPAGADSAAAAFELEHYYQPQRGQPETVWCRLQFTDRGQAERRLDYLTRVAENPDRPPPGMARPTRLRLVERRELADVRPRLPGHPAEPPMAGTSVSWRTWRGPAVDGGPPATHDHDQETVELQDLPDDQEGVA